MYGIGIGRKQFIYCFWHTYFTMNWFINWIFINTFQNSCLFSKVDAGHFTFTDDPKLNHMPKLTNQMLLLVHLVLIYNYATGSHNSLYARSITSCETKLKIHKKSIWLIRFSSQLDIFSMLQQYVYKYSTIIFYMGNEHYK